MNTMLLAEIEDLLEGADDRFLFSRADEIRKSSLGDCVYLRGVIEFSNHCVKKCAYCGLRNPNSAVRRYRLTKEEILKATALLPEFGIGTVVLQSGDDYSYGKEFIGQIIQEIKSRCDVAVTLSLGDRREDEYRYWRDCGADRYLLKIETFDKGLHEKMRSGQIIEDRLDRLYRLRKLGYEIGSGAIVGLPGMDTNILAVDILALSRLELDMIAVGPFVPHPDTPLGKELPGDLMTSYRTVALLRIINPCANIPATSSLAVLNPEGKATALRSGANVVMPSITPEAVRACYTIYPGKNTNFSKAREEVEAVRAIIYQCGLVPSSSKGFCQRNES
ncbi:[FeFe] hydrogenase H-cluster radical SAM maturase HydE [Desulfomonile tiedjei]|uniref:Iron-only hydrogenase maturation rSAM protein HydE n=1 Tax=Desulfomonile tiedjei (strain ATCC 49306 / DSM 6799 / DCB-1) TaxID=706587 RepID=I4CDW7_DESTA|nr:[FeFe] hydrogenase H-cluster radical SAM maturase HydE [Desulfomonile tiedjei]AFM27758.1 iron-only hydrogenase maturation rSAM protein HydE [Desulfomonile tiedjei DSM 6799]